MQENHWITVLMHNEKKEFQVLDSLGDCSETVLTKIAKLVSLQLHVNQNVVMRHVLHMNFKFYFQRAEIAKDTTEVNSIIATEHPDVSSWPIKEYPMPLQTDRYVRNEVYRCTCLIHE